MTTRGVTIAIWIALMAAGMFHVATTVRIDTDFSAFLPTGQSEAQRMLSRELRDGVASRLLLVEFSNASARDLAVLSRAVARTLATNADFRYVSNGEATLDGPELAFIERHRYQLSDRGDAARFDAPRLRAALEERLEGLAGGGGVLEKRWLATDPTGETLHVLAQLTPPVEPARKEGVWFDRNGSAALLVAQTRVAGWDIDGQQRATQALRAAFDEARRGTDAQMRMSSPGVMAAESRTLIAAEASRLSIASAILILGILYWAYRSLSVVALCFLPAATGLLAGVVAVNVWFGSVQAITLGFGATLLGEAVDYPSFLLTQLRSGESVPAARTRLGPTLRMAILTTACASLALLLADFPGIAQLGLLTMVGILVAGAMTYWILPLWVSASMVRVPSEAPMGAAVPLVLPLRDWQRWVIVIAAAVVVTGLAWNRPWWDDDVASMNPLPATLKERDRELRQALGAPDVRYLLAIGGVTQEEVLVRAEMVRPQLERWVAEGLLAGFDLVSDVLPSRATQARRQQSLPTAAVLRANLDEALAGLPFRPGTFAPFLQAVAEARSAAPLTIEAMTGTTFGFRTESLLRRDGDRWYAVVPLRNVADAQAIARAVAATGTSQISWLDLRAESAGMMAAWRQQALVYAALGAVLILGVLAHGLSNVRAALRLMTPVVVALALTGATLIAAGAPLSALHLIALLLVLGVGINYALFFARAASVQENRLRTLRTIGVVGGTTLAAFGMLALSRTSVLHVIGVTVCIGVVYSLLLSALWSRATATPPSPA